MRQLAQDRPLALCALQRSASGPALGHPPEPCAGEGGVSASPEDRQAPLGRGRRQGLLRNPKERGRQVDGDYSYSMRYHRVDESGGEYPPLYFDKLGQSDFEAGGLSLESVSDEDYDQKLGTFRNFLQGCLEMSRRNRGIASSGKGYDPEHQVQPSNVQGNLDDQTRE